MPVLDNFVFERSLTVVPKAVPACYAFAMREESHVIGRYAPSPTGPQHLGNLRTALLAWLHARLHQGEFLMRMEDVDTPRVVDGSDSQILRDLEWLGLDWDGPVMYQSKRAHRYQEILNDLAERELSYPCFCSRKDIRLASSAPHGAMGVYPGTCANINRDDSEQLKHHKQSAIRVRTKGRLVNDCGDFVLHRADGLYAYQLAVVVDDVDQEITHVVRGDDLASSTARQLYLANLIRPSQNSIEYHHVPLMMDPSGYKMSKRDGSFSVQQWRDSNRSAEELVGYLAHSIGLSQCSSPISVTDLRNDSSLSSLNAVFDNEV